jgi:hypothetical protein
MYKDLWGMGVACAVLLRSMGKGKNAPTIQYETMRKLRSHITNSWHMHMCPVGIGNDFLGEEGCHRRMGNVWMPATIQELKRSLEQDV